MRLTEPTGGGAAFNIATVRVIIEGVDKASEPIRKTKEQVEELSKKQSEIFPEPIMKTMESGWTKVAIALGTVATATYGLTRISPVFGSYVNQFFQALGALADTVLLPFAGAFEWVVDKVWSFQQGAESAIKVTDSLYQSLKALLGLKSESVPITSEEVGQGVGAVVGAAGAYAIISKFVLPLINTLPLPPQAKFALKGATMLGGVTAGGGIGAETGEKIGENSLTDMLGWEKYGSMSPGVKQPTLKEWLSGYKSTDNIAQKTDTNNITVSVTVQGDVEQTKIAISKALDDAFKSLGAGTGIPR